MKTVEKPSHQMDRKEKFIQLLTSHQDVLLTYIRAALGDYFTAKDVLQEVNVVLWRKAETFEEESDFRAWALRIAKFKVLSCFRDRKRNRLFYDEAALDRLAEETEQSAEAWQREERMTALEECLPLLPSKQRDLLRKRYVPGSSLKLLAASAGQSVGAVKMILLRARQTLLDCILNKTSTRVHHES